MDANQSEFLLMIQALMSPDNELRKPAEDFYMSTRATNPTLVARYEIQFLRGSQDEFIRAFCAVLIRRVVEPSAGLWKEIETNVQLEVKRELLSALQEEPSAHILRKICHVVAQVASSGVENWPSLLPAVLALTQSSDTTRREVSFFLLDKLCEYAWDQGVSTHLASILPLLGNGLSDSHVETQVRALQATVSLLVCLSDEQLASCHPLVEPMVAVLSACLTSGEELACTDAVASLIQVARAAPTFVTASLGPFASAMLTIASNASVEGGARGVALEFMLTVAKRSPATLRQHPDILAALVRVILAAMAEGEEDEDIANWGVTYPARDDGAAAEQDEEDDEVGGVLCGAAMERMAVALGAPVLQPLLESVPAMLAQPDWRQRRAGVLAMAVVGHGCHSILQPMLPQVMEMLLPFASDSSQRVRFVAMDAIAHYATDFASTFQTDYSSTVLPLLAQAINPVSGNCPRVCGNAAAATINVCHPDYISTEELQPFLQQLLHALSALLTGSHSTVQEQALTALACVARVAADEFGLFYDSFMPGVKALLMAPATATDVVSQTQQALLRGKALEAVSLMGAAVGRERFAGDAKEIMDMALAAHAHGLSSDNPVTPYIVRASAAIAGVLLEDFLPYLPMVLPSLLQSAVKEPEYTVEDVEEGTAAAGGAHSTASGMSSVVLSIRGAGEKRLTLNTTVVQEKITACRMLFQYADDLGPLFAPYVSASLAALLPCVTCKFSSTVRASAALAMPKLLHASIHGDPATAAAAGGAGAGAGVEYSTSLLVAILPPLLAQLSAERDEETRACIAEAVCGCMKECMESGGEEREPSVRVPLELVPRVVSVLMSVAAASVQRRLTVMAAAAEEEGFGEEDLEDLEEALELEAELMTQLVDGNGYLLKATKDAFIPTFDAHVSPLFARLLAAEVPAPLRCNAVCVFDDVIEHCGVGASKYTGQLLPVLIECIGDEDTGVRQAAVYGLGQIATHFPQSITQDALSQVLPQLAALASSDNARDADQVFCTENVISAFGKLLCLLPNDGAGLSQAALLPQWVSWLPLTEDEMEAKLMHRQLVQLIEQQNPHVLGGPAHTNVPHLTHIVATIMVGVDGDGDPADLASENTKSRMMAVLASWQASLPADVMSRAWAALSSAERIALAP